MANELAVREQSWNDEDIKLIRDISAKNASDSEFKLLLYLASKYDLDPLAKQIWLVKYGQNPASIYAGRDGFLKIAHDSGLFDGMVTKAMRSADGKLLGASCTVWRKDMSHPFEVEVALSEYNTNQNQWKDRPETMVKKVAESQCLRKAFPISGLYSPEEMGDERQAPQPRQQEVVDTTTGEIVTPPQIEAPKPKQHRKLSEYEQAKRSDTHHAIFTTTGVNTVDVNCYFVPISLDECQAAAKKIAGCDLSAALKKYNIEGTWSDVVKVHHNGEGLKPAQQFSAVLHLVYAYEQDYKAQHQTTTPEQDDVDDEWDALTSASTTAGV